MNRNLPRIAGVSIVLCTLAACGSHHESAPPTAASSSAPSGASSAPAAVAAPTALQSTDLKDGTGTPIANGQIAQVQYTGWLYDPAAADHKGKQFDSSRDRGPPFEFPLGTGQVIKGWDEGVLGMKVGGQRRLVIPSDLGYGDKGAGDDIPPNAALVFDVELVGIK